MDPVDVFRLKTTILGQSNGTGNTMQDIRAITLDLDDTLWAIGPVIARAEESLQAWFATHYPKIAASYTPEATMTLRDQVIADHPDRSHDMSFLRREVIARLAKSTGHDGFPIDDACAVFTAARNDLELFPDVRPALRALGQRFTLIAVTNGNADLDRIGIGDLFDGLVSARMAGAAKPDRKIFDIAVGMGGVTAVETLHVGDHPQMDVVGARDAGLRSVWINRDGAEWPQKLPKPDGVVADLLQLEQLMLD